MKNLFCCSWMINFRLLNDWKAVGKAIKSIQANRRQNRSKPSNQLKRANLPICQSMATICDLFVALNASLPCACQICATICCIPLPAFLFFGLRDWVRLVSTEGNAWGNSTWTAPKCPQVCVPLSKSIYYWHQLKATGANLTWPSWCTCAINYAIIIINGNKLVLLVLYRF